LEQHAKFPLLEQVDWFFTSAAWTNLYTQTLFLPLAKTTSYHIPCKIQIGTRIPKANTFRFENCWFSHENCISQISNTWSIPSRRSNSAHVISDKFKLLRRVLKHWAKGLSSLSNLISKCNATLAFFDKQEEFRDLLHPEATFRNILKLHIKNLLKMQNTYWKQRFTQRLVQYGDENSSFMQWQ